MEVATARRLSDELNVEASLEYVYRFCYTADFGEAGSENELCHVFLGKLRGSPKPNASEIAELRFLAARELEEEFARSPERFTPWFRQEWMELSSRYRRKLAQYAAPTGLE